MLNEARHPHHFDVIQKVGREEPGDLMYLAALCRECGLIGSFCYIAGDYDPKELAERIETCRPGEDAHDFSAL